VFEHSDYFVHKYFIVNSFWPTKVSFIKIRCNLMKRCFRASSFQGLCIGLSIVTVIELFWLGYQISEKLHDAKKKSQSTQNWNESHHKWRQDFGQFHQHFTSSFIAVALCPKAFRSKLQVRLTFVWKRC
jgi:hypothetical protein